MNLLEEIEETSNKTPLNQGAEDYTQVFFDLFNLYVGPGKRYSLGEVSSATSIPIKTLQNYSQRISAPSFQTLGILCRVMPFEFKSRFINMLGGTDLASEIRKDYAGILEEVASKMRQGAI